MMHSCRCPYCKREVRYGHGNPLQQIGSPLQDCPSCHRKYLDNNMYEWSLIPLYRKIHLLLFANCKWFLHMAVFAVSFGLDNSAWCFLIFFIFDAIICGILVFLMLFFNDTAIKKSYERAKDIAYIDSLAASQYDKLSSEYFDDYMRRKEGTSAKASGTK